LTKVVAFVVAGVLGGNGSAAAQDVSNGSSGWVGPWHAAIELAARLSSDTAGMADVLAAAESELALGRPESALQILSRHLLPDSVADGAPLAIHAAAQYDLGAYVEAGRVFDRAAAHATGLRRGTLRARAAEAYERGGRSARAKALYRQAAADFPDADGWLALREALITRDSKGALDLLHKVPVAGSELAAGARAVFLAREGEPATAAEALAQVGHFAKAAELALEAGLSARARELVYRAVALRERAQALEGVAMATEEFPPETADEHMGVGRAILRYGRARDAVPHSANAVNVGDSSIATLMFHGEVTEASGNRWGALAIYEAAARREGDEAGEAAYRHARTYVRLGQRTRAAQALRGFLEAYPDHSRGPAATYLLGDLRQDQGRLAAADSIFAALNEAWPSDAFASDARSRLGARTLARGDTAQAMEMFREEVEQRGSRARAAHYQIGQLAMETGDTAVARDEWENLARSDSIGYYGTMARLAAGLPPPVFAPQPPTQPSAAVLRQLAVLDLLQEVGFEDEAEALIEHLGDPDHWSVTQLMDVAEGLIARGQARAAVAVGWRLASLHRLNDPRVLRIIFPWPNRELLEREAAEFDLDPFLLVALVRQESAFDANATSRAGARGMMQLMPATARGLARQLQVDWENAYLGIADANVHLGAAHLAQMLRQYDGEVVPALAAYNAGGSRMRRWGRYPEARAKDWFRFIERIPFPETRGYVQTLLRNRELYKALFGEIENP
jgi:soluble lytic murein transglycosylase-like protein